MFYSSLATREMMMTVIQLSDVSVLRYLSCSADVFFSHSAVYGRFACLRYVTSAFSADVLQSPRCIRSLRFAYNTLPVPPVQTCFLLVFLCLFTLLVLLCLFHSTHAVGPPHWLTNCSTHIFLLGWLPSDRPHVMSQPRLRSPSHIAPHQLSSSAASSPQDHSPTASGSPV